MSGQDRTPDRLVVVISDIEMGAGGPFDDFPHSEFLADLIASYAGPPHDNLAVDLVFNGDTFDLLKTSYNGEFPHIIDAEVAVGKMERVIAAHEPVFDALIAFLGQGDRHVHFIVGNHDMELLFPEVQVQIRRRLGDHQMVYFPGVDLDIGDVHIEHGQQVDPMFRMDRPFFVEYEGRRILNLPWGSVALLDVALPLRHILYHHDRLKPREEAFRLLPDVRDFLMDRFWTYWTRDYLRGWWAGRDPMARVSWNMIRELAYRFRSRDGGVSVGAHFIERLYKREAFRIYTFGHEHESGWWTHEGRKLLRTGAFRDEYRLLDDGREREPIPKVYGEIFMRGETSVSARLVALTGPPAPEGHVPDSIYDVLELIRPLMGTLEERESTAAARRAIENDD